MTFLCQFRFTESRDLVGDLPGDILLIFVPDYDLCEGRPDPMFAFEWYPLGLTDLVLPADVPAPDWEFVTCYGVRHRTVDYVDSGFAATEVMKSLLTEQELKNPWAGFYLARWMGTKIGGLDFRLDVIWHDDAYEQTAHRPGRQLCTLSFIGPAWDVPFPWINQPEPIDISDIGDSQSLIFRDGFALDFRIDDQGEIEWYVQFA